MSAASYRERICSVMFHDGVSAEKAAVRVARSADVPLDDVLVEAVNILAERPNEANTVDGPFAYYGAYWTARRLDGSFILNEHGLVHFPTREAAEAAR